MRQNVQDKNLMNSYEKGESYKLKDIDNRFNIEVTTKPSKNNIQEDEMSK